MKRNIVFILLLLIFLPVGLIGSTSVHIPLNQAIGDLAQFLPGELQKLPFAFEAAEFSGFGTQGENTLAIAPLQDDSIDLYCLLELDLQTNVQADNPYAPDEIDLRVAFRAPSRKLVQVGAFWYQGFDQGTHKLLGKPGWKVRFTPDEIGVWQAVAFAPSLGLNSSPVSFEVKPSENPGFIHINPANPRYLAADDGDTFFPIGVNMAWWDDGRDPIDQYTSWLDKFSSNGGNTIRVWMAAWSYGIEWQDTGLGNYDKRQYEAWLLDQLFKLAEERHVKIILVLINHGAFSLAANSEWSDNPYNASLGGPLTQPEEFVKDRTAKAYFKQRLNYIINRWGYSPDLLAWEWFNEVNLTPISDATLVPWLKEMTAFLDKHDVNHHLTTSSFAMRAQSAIWKIPGLDIIQMHEYSSQINASDHDLAGRAVSDFQALAGSLPEKPILMGEFGYSAENYGDDIEKTGIHLHNGLWSTAFSGYAGTGMYWWWDTYIDPYNLWYHFNGLASFLAGEDLARFQPYTSLQISRPGENASLVTGLGLRGEKFMVWLRSNAYTVQASIAARSGKSLVAPYNPPQLQGLSLVLSNVADGRYTVRWFDPQAAEWQSEQLVIAVNHALSVSIPAFSKDLAAKIIPIP